MKKLLIGLLIGLMVFSLACAAPAGSQSPGEAGDNPVAIVDGEAISRAEFNRNLAMIKYTMMQRHGPNYFDNETDELMDPLREQLLEDMIEEHLVLREAAKADIGPTKEYIDDIFNRYLEANFGTEESPSEAGKPIRQYLTDNDIDDDFLYRMIKNNQTIREYIADIQTKIEEDTAAKDELLDTSVAQVTASHILLPLDQKDKVDELYQILKDDPGQFAELAKEHSIDGSAQNGGELGSFVRTEMVPQFNDAAFDAEIGVVTEPVESQFGWHLILVSDKKTLDEMKADEVEEAKMALATRGIMEDTIRREYYRRISEWKEAAKIEKFDLKGE